MAKKKIQDEWSALDDLPEEPISAAPSEGDEWSALDDLPNEAVSATLSDGTKLRKPTIRERLFLNQVEKNNPEAARKYQMEQGIDPNWDEGTDVQDFLVDPLDDMAEIAGDTAGGALGAMGGTMIGGLPGGAAGLYGGAAVGGNVANTLMNLAAGRPAGEGAARATQESVIGSGLGSLLRGAARLGRFATKPSGDIVASEMRSQKGWKKYKPEIEKGTLPGSDFVHSSNRPAERVVEIAKGAKDEGSRITSLMQDRAKKGGGKVGDILSPDTMGKIDRLATEGDEGARLLNTIDTNTKLNNTPVSKLKSGKESRWDSKKQVLDDALRDLQARTKETGATRDAKDLVNALKQARQGVVKDEIVKRRQVVTAKKVSDLFKSAENATKELQDRGAIKQVASEIEKIKSAAQGENYKEAAMQVKGLQKRLKEMRDKITDDKIKNKIDQISSDISEVYNLEGMGRQAGKRVEDFDDAIRGASDTVEDISRTAKDRKLRAYATSLGRKIDDLYRTSPDAYSLERTGDVREVSGKKLLDLYYELGGEAYRKSASQAERQAAKAARQDIASHFRKRMPPGEWDKLSRGYSKNAEFRGFLASKSKKPGGLSKLPKEPRDVSPAFAEELQQAADSGKLTPAVREIEKNQGVPLGIKPYPPNILNIRPGQPNIGGIHPTKTGLAYSGIRAGAPKADTVLGRLLYGKNFPRPGAGAGVLKYKGPSQAPLDWINLLVDASLRSAPRTLNE